MSLKVMSIADHIPPVDRDAEKAQTEYTSSTFQTSSNIGKRRREEEAEQREDAAKRQYLWVSTAAALGRNIADSRIRAGAECLGGNMSFLLKPGGS
jgi:hypothetical protein